MKLPFAIFLPFITFLVACSPSPSPDAELEKTLSGMVEAEELVAMYTFDQIVVNISGQQPFQLQRNARKDLAERLANTALGIHPDASMIMIGFNRAKPELEQIAYTWENQDGSLSLVANQ